MTTNIEYVLIRVQHRELLLNEGLGSVPVVDHLRVLDGGHQAPEHDGQVGHLLTVVVPDHRHVSDHHIGQHLNLKWVQGTR